MFEKVVKVIRAILIFILAAFAVYATIDSIFNGLSTNITQTNVVNAATTTSQPKISQAVEIEKNVVEEEKEPEDTSDVVKPEIQATQNIYGLTSDDRKKMAKTLFRESNRPYAGDTESSKVVWTMLNRFDEGFDDDMGDILAASYDFREESPVTEENIALVNDVICRWVAEKNGMTDVGRTLPRDFYYFWGDGQKNHFYKYSSGGIGQSGDAKIAYDNSLATPYSS